MSTATTAVATAKASTSSSSPALTEQEANALFRNKTGELQALASVRHTRGRLILHPPKNDEWGANAIDLSRTFCPTMALHRRQKIGELEREAEEHGLVIETLTEANATTPDRKCFRLVGGILVERTVADVLPALKTQLEQLKGVLGTLLGEYKKKETSFSEWQRDNNIVVQR